MLNLQLCAENDVLLPHSGLQRNATRRIWHIGVDRLVAGTTTSPELLCISVLGESFLYRMVRYIAIGLLLQKICVLCLVCLVVTLSFHCLGHLGQETKSAKKRENPMSMYPYCFRKPKVHGTPFTPPKFNRRERYILSLQRSKHKSPRIPCLLEVFALVLAGRHRATAQSFRQLLEPKRRKRQKRVLGLRPAPAHGLQLAEVQLTQAMQLKPKVASKRWRPCQGRKTPKIQVRCLKSRHLVYVLRAGGGNQCGSPIRESVHSAW